MAINAFEQQKQKYSVFMIACIFCESKFVYRVCKNYTWGLFKYYDICLFDK